MYIVNNMRYEVSFIILIGGVMKVQIVKLSKEDKLKTSIDILRAVLNEMCCTIDEREVSIEKLNVSQQLDNLIVEYMGLKN